MLLIVFDNNQPIAIPYKLAYEMAKTIHRIVKDNFDAET